MRVSLGLTSVGWRNEDLLESFDVKAIDEAFHDPTAAVVVVNETDPERIPLERVMSKYFLTRLPKVLAVGLYDGPAKGWLGRCIVVTRAVFFEPFPLINSKIKDHENTDDDYKLRTVLFAGMQFITTAAKTDSLKLTLLAKHDVQQGEFPQKDLITRIKEFEKDPFTGKYFLFMGQQHENVLMARRLTGIEGTINLFPDLKAVAFYKEAIARGELSACYPLGNLYYNGLIDGKHTIRKALKYLRLGMNGGDAKAALKLGEIYLNDFRGSSVLKESKRLALEAFSQGVRLGNKECAAYLGSVLHAKWDDTSKISEEEVRSLRMGVRLHSQECANLLGGLCLNRLASRRIDSFSESEMQEVKELLLIGRSLDVSSCKKALDCLERHDMTDASVGDDLETANSSTFKEAESPSLSSADLMGTMRKSRSVLYQLDGCAN